MSEEIKYKSTGINWMPEIPQNWNSRRAKGLFEERSEKNSPGLPLLAASQTQGVVLKSMLQFRSMEAVKNFDTFKVVKEGDFVISLRSFEGGIELSYFEGIISPVYCVFKKRNIDQIDIHYFKYLFKSLPFIQELNIYKTGIRDGQSISYRNFAYIYLPLPPLREQQLIAKSLDAESAKIAHFVERKERFIELLKEQRQSVIEAALDIDAPKRRLKFCVTKVGSGVTPRGGATVYQSAGVVFLRSQNVHNDGLRLDDVAFISSAIHAEMKGSQVRNGDVLLNITGASIGRCHAFDKDYEANVNQHVSVIRPITDVLDCEFLMFQLQSTRIQNLIGLAQGSSREGLTIHEIKNYYLYVPSLEMQKKIVDHIKSETRLLDKTISKAQREIELMKEYREAMIAEAVTGKKTITKEEEWQ